jgi:RNA-directed DNA polymerase
MSNDRKLTREEIWQRIRETSREEFVLSEMQRLGFWPKDSTKPSLAETFIQERSQHERRLRELTQELAKVQDPEQALKLLHAERKADALKRREETRRKRNQDRFERATHWHQSQQQEISYLGQKPNDSGGRSLRAALKNKSMDHARLAKQSLPLIGNSAELATAMGISLNELRFLCFQREISTVSHYRHFTIPKKPTGERRISAPMPRLKRAQYWVLANVLEKLPVTEFAHGFVKSRNIVSNATLHVGRAVVINMDLQNFFPTVTYRRVKGLFKQLGYSEEVATLFALLCSEPHSESYELDGQVYHIKSDEPLLPQGAPTSPAISNLICRRLDKRLAGMAGKLQFTYSRYADDMTFSSQVIDNTSIKKLCWRARKIIESEGLALHSQKTRIMRQHQQQEVTGIVVNQRPAVCRKELKKFRALLFQIDRDGPDGKQWREGNLFNSIAGYANFVAMVDAKKGQALNQKVAALIAKYKAAQNHALMGKLSNHVLKNAAAAGQAPIATWWQAARKPEPVLELTQQQRNEIRQQEKQAVQEETAAPGNTANTNRNANNSSAARAASRPSSTPTQGSTGKKANRLPWWVWLILIWVVIRLLSRL